MSNLAGKIWSILGIALSASSIASLMQIGFDFKLALSPSEILNFYRDLMHPIFQLLYQPIQWVFGDIKIPNWVIDAQTLSIVVSSIYVRAKNAKRVNREVVHYKSLVSKLVAIFMLGLTMLGLLFLPVILLGMIMLPVYYINQVRWQPQLKWYQYKKVLKSVYLAAGNEGALFNTSAIYAYIALVVVFAFYLWNSMIL
ncbi:MAG: hypothetical protein AB3N10_03535 [Allomuricauda sp.]